MRRNNLRTQNIKTNSTFEDVHNKYQMKGGKHASNAHFNANTCLPFQFHHSVLFWDILCPCFPKKEINK